MVIYKYTTWYTSNPFAYVPQPSSLKDSYRSGDKCTNFISWNNTPGVGLHRVTLSIGSLGDPKKHIEFERGRKTRNPNRSNARYSLSKPMAIDSHQIAFALYDLI